MAAKAYDHKQQQSVLRPDIGLQAQFKKKLPPATCRYDRSLDPPYGVKSGSNFQPFIRKRDVRHNDDAVLPRQRHNENSPAIYRRGKGIPAMPVA